MTLHPKCFKIAVKESCEAEKRVEIEASVSKRLAELQASLETKTQVRTKY